jgi:Glycosyl hydrolases family 18
VKSRRLLRISLGILLVVAAVRCGRGDTDRDGGGQQGITLPVSTAWFYMSDDRQYNEIPAYWSEVDFTHVDVLTVGPAGVQADGTFGLYNSAATGDLANRFKWVIQTARAHNPKIKIIVSQWWGDGSGRKGGPWGNALSALADDASVQKYTASVYDFFNAYLRTAGGVDGYDIDYESNNVDEHTEAITRQIRAQLSRLSQATGGRPFYLTVSPADTRGLDKTVAGYLDFVNLQTYAGGRGSIDPDKFTALGLKSTQLLYGICPETGCDSPSLADVEKAYTDYKLGGIHLWRLNSGNYQHEGVVQRQVYDFLHPPS